MINPLSSCCKFNPDLSRSAATVILMITNIGFFCIGMATRFYVLEGLAGAAFLGEGGVFLAQIKKMREAFRFNNLAQRNTLPKFQIEREHEINGLKAKFKEDKITHLVFSFLRKPGDLVNASKVCKYWHSLINQKGSETLKCLELAFDHGLPLIKQMNELVKELFAPDSDFFRSIPTIFDIKEKPEIFVGAAPGYFNFDLFLPLFQREGAAILKAQDRNGRWWFFMRVSLTKKGKNNSDRVIVLSQKYTGTKCWKLLSQNAELSTYDRILIPWFQRLFAKQTCGHLVTDTEGALSEKNELGTYSLWNPESDSSAIIQ